MRELVSPRKARPGERVAILSPSFAAPAVAPAVHEQAMARLAEATGLVPVEYPTTRRRDASPEERAVDLNAAFGDPGIRAVLATIGGSDQISVIRHLDAEAVRRDPKPFLGYSDNTNLLNWLWTSGVRAFHGGSTQVHLGPGPAIDEVHLASLRAALLTGGELEVVDPGESEDVGLEWSDPRALHRYGERRATEPWMWSGPARRVSGPTWGGCLEIVGWLGLARRLPDPERLDGAVLLVETSEDRPTPEWVGWWLRALGEGGYLAACAGVLVARPVVSARDDRPDIAESARRRTAFADAVHRELDRYAPDAVACIGVPFGHTRPQWILPYGGSLTLNGAARTVSADYS